MIAFQRGGLPADTDPFVTMKHGAPYRAATRLKLRHAWVLPYQIYRRAAILDAVFTRNRSRQVHQRLVAGLDAVQAELLV